MAPPAPMTSGLGDQILRVSALRTKLDEAFQSLVTAQVVFDEDDTPGVSQLRDRVRKALEAFEAGILECDQRDDGSATVPAAWAQFTKARRGKRLTISGGPGEESPICHVSLGGLSKNQVAVVTQFFSTLCEISDEIEAVSREATEICQRRLEQQPKMEQTAEQPDLGKTGPSNRKLEKRPESKPDAVNARSRAKLLEEYNEIKDIAQQLIGMIAEYRGVPVKSLYESGEFGVSPDD